MKIEGARTVTRSLDCFDLEYFYLECFNLECFVTECFVPECFEFDTGVN